MSKSVTIPTFMQPDFICTINNVTYRYKAGTTQTVPDEVAELIENINAQEPVENPPETEEEMAARVAEGVVTDTLNNRLVFLAVDLSDYDFSDGAVDVSDAFEDAGIEPTQWEKWLERDKVPLISFTFGYDDASYTAVITSMTAGTLHCVFPLFGSESSVSGTACLTVYNSSAQQFIPYARIDVVGG